MDGGPRVLSTKTLPVAYSLQSAALCPADVDLAALTSPPAASESKVALYRTGAAPDRVWEWAPPPPLAPPPTGKFGGLGLKGKAKAGAKSTGKVGRIAWNPQGNVLAVLVTPPASSSTSASTLSLLSVHTGTPLLSPAAPLPSGSTPTFLDWQHLPLPHDPLLPSWGIRLIDRLPALPKILKDGLPSAGAAEGLGSGRLAFGVGGPGSGSAGDGLGGGAGGGGGGVFGAKQAMLERERAKEAQRPLTLQDATERFPTFLPAARTDNEGGSGSSSMGDPRVRTMLRPGEEGDKDDEAEHTMLCVGDEKGAVHLYLGGSVYLGSLETGGQVLAVTALPSPAATASFAIHLSTPTSALSVRHLSLPLPPTLSTVLRQSSALRALLQHAFDALQEARNLWDEARRIGKGWLQRIADVSRPHGVTTAPSTQLHLLLVTGRPTRSLHDFLASKMNERGLVKWEQAMGLALERLRSVGWMSVAPAMERVVVLLQEVDAWARWPEKFGHHQIDRDDVLRAMHLTKQAIRATARFQQEVEEEEISFKQFGLWLHYELEKVAQQEGSEVRPVAAFRPLPVSHYIQHRLPATATTVSPFLAFGLANSALKDCKELKEAEEWIAQLPARARALLDQELGLGIDLDETHDGEKLDALLKRMTEELQGQIDADLLASSAGPPFAPRSAAAGAPNALSSTRVDGIDTDINLVGPSAFAQSTADPDAAPRPSASVPLARLPISPKSLPVLLHLSARLVGGVMDRAVRTATGAHAQVTGEVERAATESSRLDGPPAEEEADRFRLRTWVGQDGRLEEVWTSGSTITFARQRVRDDLSKVETAAHELRLLDGSALRVMQLDFGLDGEVLLGCCALKEGGGPSRYLIGHIKLEELDWSPVPRKAISPIPLSRRVLLDSAYPPSALAFRTTTSGRQLAASISGEGRRLEVLDASASDIDMEL